MFTNTFIRLRTTFWGDKKGLYTKKSLTFLKRLGPNPVLAEDVNQTGADLVIPRIQNLNSVPDGVYKVVTCNESTDWETGFVDDYDYLLIPLT